MGNLGGGEEDERGGAGGTLGFIRARCCLNGSATSAFSNFQVKKLCSPCCEVGTVLEGTCVVFTVQALFSGRPGTPLLQIAHCSGRRLLDPENPGELSNLQKRQQCRSDSRVRIPMLPHCMVCVHTVSIAHSRGMPTGVRISSHPPLPGFQGLNSGHRGCFHCQVASAFTL